MSERNDTSKRLFFAFFGNPCGSGCPLIFSGFVGCAMAEKDADPIPVSLTGRPEKPNKRVLRILIPVQILEISRQVSPPKPSDSDWSTMARKGICPKIHGSAPKCTDFCFNKLI